MRVVVLMSSGTEDEWDDLLGCEMDIRAGGALLLTAGTKEEPSVVAVYAPGMWMKFEINPAEDDAE